MSDQRDVDSIIESVKVRNPDTCVRQLEVKFPSDDNGIWYFWNPSHPDDDIQIENSTGQCPFLIESNRDDTRIQVESVEEVVSIICQHLRTAIEHANE